MAHVSLSLRAKFCFKGLFLIVCVTDCQREGQHEYCTGHLLVSRLSGTIAVHACLYKVR